MTQSMSLGNSIRPLRNVAALTTLIKRVEGREFGLPGMAVFYGPTGFGKTYAACHASAVQKAIHIPVQRLWTQKTLLTAILRELSIVPRKTLAEMMMQANEALAAAQRPLIIDETDYAIERGMIEIIRDFHDGSHVPVILIGMEMLPQKLRKWELVDGRILSWVAAEPADLRDARLLADIYAIGVKIDDALLKRILQTNKGSVRRISTDLAHVLEQSKLQGVREMTLDAWGDAPFLRGDAPGPREGLL